MARRFKLRLSFPSFQFCRLKHLSSLPRTPAPATYRFSPFNPKAFDISYPNVPEPPPSTPNHPLFKSNVPTAKIVPVTVVDCGPRSRSCSQYNTSKHITTKSPPEYKMKEQHKTQNVLYNSPVSDVCDSGTWPEKDGKKKKTKTKAKGSVCKSTSSVDSGWFSTEGSDYNEESESLISSSMSFDSTSYEFGGSLESISETSISEGRKNKKKNNLKVRRLKRYVSTIKTTSPENMSPAKTPSVFRRMMPCAVEGKVKESFAVVKRSEDPYEDFKRSMLEMILEKQMFDAKDLEQLLQCFLSLNSRHHHEAIVGAFAEVWEVLFGDSTSSRQVSMGH